MSTKATVTGLPTAAEAAPPYAVHVDYGVAVPMRDGTVLRADLYRPAADGQFPVLIERVAYELRSRVESNGAAYASRGYVVVGQNVRGRYASEGRFTLCRDDGWGERQDGYDTIEWAAAQPWSSGDIGMLDGSYSGGTQYLVAPTRPPHLKALYVRAGFANPYRDCAYRGGTLQLRFIREWALRAIVLARLRHETAPARLAARVPELEAAAAAIDDWNRRLPVKSFPPLEELGDLSDWYFEWLEHPAYDDFWRAIDLATQYAAVDVPIMHLAGWFDVFADSAIRSFAGIRAHGRTERSRDAQRLVIGPWIHGPAEVGKRQVGELDFGPEAVFDLDAHRLRWYDHWLKGADTGVMDGAPVRVFLMGANHWLDLPDWPPADIAYQPAYFHAGRGPSDASLNNGWLAFVPPAAEAPPERFTYDPADPVPSLLAYPQLGPTDHRPVEGQMLTFTSDVLQDDLTVVGSVKAVLFAASSAPDTDWVVRLCDVWPDGRSLSVCDGILRARFRDSIKRPALMTPGEPCRFEIDLWATAQVFRAGHRLRVEVTSSDFPRYDRNLNTGGPFGEETSGQVAINTVFHDAMRPSHVLLAVLPR